MLSSYEILLYASSLKPRDFVRIVPYRWKNSLGPRVKDIVWRKDMSRYVLDLLQNQTFRLLDPSVYFTTSAVGSSGGPAPTDLDSALDSGITWVTSPALHGVDSNKVIALLWLGVYGSEGHPVKVAKQKGVGINFDNTRTFSTLQGPKGTYLPVFNLTHILTRAQISQLRESHDGLRNGVLVLEPGKKSAGVLRWLWQLSLYVGLDTEVDATMGHHTLYVENSEHGGG